MGREVHGKSDLLLVVGAVVGFVSQSLLYFTAVFLECWPSAELLVTLILRNRVFQVCFLSQE